VGQLAKLFQSGPPLADSALQQRRGGWVTVGMRGGTGKSDVVRQGQKSLLRAVVQVAFEPAPLRVPRFDDSRTRRPELFQLSQHLGLKPFVLKAQPNGSADLTFEISHLRRVRDHRDQMATPNQGRERAAGPRVRLRDGSTLSIHKPVGIRAPVRDAQIGVANGPGHSGRKGTRHGYPAKARGEPGDRTAPEPGTHRSPHQASREQDRRRAPREEDREEGEVGWVLGQCALGSRRVRDHWDGEEYAGAGHRK
jgi:hypothetical protein